LVRIPLAVLQKLSQHEQPSAVLGTPVEHHLRSTLSSITHQGHNTDVSTSNSKAVNPGMKSQHLSIVAPRRLSSLFHCRIMYNARRNLTPPQSLTRRFLATAVKTKPLMRYPVLPSITVQLRTSIALPPNQNLTKPSRGPSSILVRKILQRTQTIQVGRYPSSLWRCHLGGPAAPPDPAKVNGTCVFWKSAVRHDEKGGGAPEKQVLAPGFTCGSPSVKRTSRSMPGQAVDAGRRCCPRGNGSNS
jgi:hypothetical protein